MIQWPQLHNELSKKIKENILIEHIYPYLRESANKNMLTDIISFVNTTSELHEKYTFEYKPITLFNDLLYFMNNRVVAVDGETSTPNYLKILHRFHRGKMLKDEDIYAKFLNFNFPKRAEDNITRINRTMLAMMSPEEREYFIKKYVEN